MEIKMYLSKLLVKVIPEPISNKIKHYKNKQRRFGNEIKLLNGKKINQHETKSVIFFTTHKCASTYMSKCMGYINEKYLKLIHINFMSYLWLYSSQDTFEILEKKKYQAFQPQGFLYSPLRKYVSIPEIDRYYVLLMLRDPRDVMVSEYYSVAYSHPLSLNQKRKEELLNRRNIVREKTIDEYVIEKAPHYHKVYSEYCNHLVKNKNTFVLKYEDFMLNFDSWLNQLEQCLKINISQEDRFFLYELKGGSGNIIENKLNHIRKGIPGDYKNKLTEETQNFLDSKFQDILLTLHYE